MTILLGLTLLFSGAANADYPPLLTRTACTQANCLSTGEASYLAGSSSGGHILFTGKNVTPQTADPNNPNYNGAAFELDGQIYDPSGKAVGASFVAVPAYTPGLNQCGVYYAGSQAAMQSDGTFAVVWTGDTSNACNDQQAVSGNFISHYDASGKLLGTVAAQGMNYLLETASIFTADPSDSGYLWVIGVDGGSQSQYIVAARYDSAGGVMLAPFTVTTDHSDTGNGSVAAVAAPDGGFVVGWITAGPQTDPYGADPYTGVAYARYQANGTVTIPETLVTSKSDLPLGLAIGMDNSGNFVIAWWLSADNQPPYGPSNPNWNANIAPCPSASADPGYGGTCLMAQRFNAAGALQGAGFYVDQYVDANHDGVADYVPDATEGYNYYGPAVAFDASGNFAIAFNATMQSPGGGAAAYKDVVIERYAGDGTSLGSAIGALHNPGTFAPDAQSTNAARPALIGPTTLSVGQGNGLLLSSAADDQYKESDGNVHGYADLLVVTPAFTLPTAPPVPTNVQALAGNGQVTLSWNASPGASDYHIYEATSAAGPLTVVGGSPGTSRTLTGLSNGTSYYFEIKAYNGSYSAASAVVSATPVAPIPPPPAPANVKAQAGNGQVTLSWSASAGASDYHIYEATSAAGPFTVVGGSPDTSRTLTGLSNGTKYYFEIKAYNGSYSAPSSVVSATPRLLLFLFDHP